MKRMVGYGWVREGMVEKMHSENRLDLVSIEG